MLNIDELPIATNPKVLFGLEGLFTSNLFLFFFWKCFFMEYY